MNGQALILEVPTLEVMRPASMQPMLDDLPSRLKWLRKQKGEAQADVAEAIGISRPYLSGLETGADIPGRETLMAIADYYGTNLDWLATGEGQSAQSKVCAETSAENQLLQAFRQLPEIESKILLEMILSRVRPLQN